MDQARNDFGKTPDMHVIDEQWTDDDSYRQVRQGLQDRLVDAMDDDLLVQAVSDSARIEVIRQTVESLLVKIAGRSTSDSHRRIVQEVLDEIIGLGPIEPLLREPGVTEIRVLGPTEVYAVRDGTLRLTGRRFTSDSHLMRILQKIFAPLGKDVHPGSPPLHGVLRDGSLVVATVPGHRLLPGTIEIRRPPGPGAPAAGSPNRADADKAR